MDKVLNKAGKLIYVMWGLNGAIIGLGLACISGALNKWWVIIPTIPFAVICAYIWGLEDAIDVIVEDK